MIPLVKKHTVGMNVMSTTSRVWVGLVDQKSAAGQTVGMAEWIIDDLLLIFSFSDQKKKRVEALTSFAKYNTSSQNLELEDSKRSTLGFQYRSLA